MTPAQLAEGVSRAQRALEDIRRSKSACIAETKALVLSLGAELSGLAEGERLGMALASGQPGAIALSLAECASMFIGFGEIKALTRLAREHRHFRRLHEALAHLLAREHNAEKMLHEAEILATKHIPPVPKSHPGAHFHKTDPHGRAVDELKKPYLHNPPPKPTVKPHADFPQLGFSMPGSHDVRPLLPLAPGHTWRFKATGTIAVRHRETGMVLSSRPRGVWVVSAAHS